MPTPYGNLGLVRVAIDEEYVGFAHPVLECDEVALFPAGDRRLRR